MRGHPGAYLRTYGSLLDLLALGGGWATMLGAPKRWRLLRVARVPGVILAARALPSKPGRVLRELQLMVRCPRPPP